MVLKISCFLTLLTAPAMADLTSIPTYSYFYTCDSGFVDCGAFPEHWNGDFGLSGLQPVNWPGDGLGTGRFNPAASNAEGEVIGNVTASFFAEPLPGYGVNGTVYFVLADGAICPDLEEQAVDINNNGLYVFASLGEGGSFSLIGLGQTATELSSVIDVPGILTAVPLGINDENQVLADAFSGLDSSVEGVFSPFPVTVPEPSSLYLLITVVCASGAIRAILPTKGSHYHLFRYWFG